MTDNINVIESTPSYVTIGFDWTPTTTVPGYSFTGAFSNTPLTFTATTVIDNQGDDLQGPLTIVEYFWNFGDGIVGYGNPVTHTYDQPFFNAATSLRITDSKGRQWFTRNQMYVNSEGTTVFDAVARDFVTIFDAAFAVILTATGHDLSVIASDVAIVTTNFIEGVAFDLSLITDAAFAIAPYLDATANDTSNTLVVVSSTFVVHKVTSDMSVASDNAFGNTRGPSKTGADTSLASDSASRHRVSTRATSDTSTIFDNATGGGNPVPLGIPGSWTLIFDDEFDGSSLNLDIWTPGWFNTPISNPVNGAENNAYNSDNVSVSGGNLNLDLTNVSITAPNTTTYPYTASLISSQPNGSNTGFMWGPYGVYEARVYMPGGGSLGNGLANWPAVWAVTTPTEDSAGHYNEYDVFEALSGFAAWHFHCATTVGSNVGSITSGWHVVSVNWQPGTLTFYYDGTEVGSATSGVLGNPVYLVLNHSVSTSQTAVLGAPFLVDYVRVWS